MPKFLEDKLKKEYGAKSAIPYKVMNSIGAMKGNKETAKGREMEKKHAMKFSHTHIDHLSDGTHVVTHHPAMKMSKSGAMHEAMGEPVKYSAGSDELFGKMADHGVGEAEE